MKISKGNVVISRFALSLLLDTVVDVCYLGCDIMMFDRLKV